MFALAVDVDNQVESAEAEMLKVEEAELALYEQKQSATHSRNSSKGGESHKVSSSLIIREPHEDSHSDDHYNICY